MTNSACLDELVTQAQAAQRWLLDVALPYWLDAGTDGGLGFVEQLTLRGDAADVDFKRLRVQARQLYVFSHAYLNGYAPGLEAAAGGWEFMRRHGWTRAGSWARTLGRRGGILDPTPDLYDHAFALFGLAWWGRASGEDIRPWAERTLDAIDRHLSTADGHGWWSEGSAAKSLLQNPHMHLLEACLVAHQATAEETFRVYGRRVLDLFQARLMNRRTGTLSEQFTSDWRRVSGEAGRLVEPGHHYEWVWLLAHAREWFPEADAHAGILFEFAERYGSNSDSGLVYDGVLDDGTVLASSHRLWPNTEALKAHLARFELTGAIDCERVSQILSNLFAYYLGQPAPGLWIDQLDSYRRPESKMVPASSLYHVHLALAELQRLSRRLMMTRDSKAVASAD